MIVRNISNNIESRRVQMLLYCSAQTKVFFHNFLPHPSCQQKTRCIWSGRGGQWWSLLLLIRRARIKAPQRATSTPLMPSVARRRQRFHRSLTEIPHQPPTEPRKQRMQSHGNECSLGMSPQSYTFTTGGTLLVRDRVRSWRTPITCNKM